MVVFIYGGQPPGEWRLPAGVPAARLDLHCVRGRDPPRRGPLAAQLHPGACGCLHA